VSLGKGLCLSGLSSNDESANSRLRTVEMVNVRCKITVQFAGRVSKSHEYPEARISLLSAKGKARLVAGCPSGKYLTGVCATVFLREGRSHVEMVERKSKVKEVVSREDEETQISRAVKTVASKP
jgi:hypothetical protein